MQINLSNFAVEHFFGRSFGLEFGKMESQRKENGGKKLIKKLQKMKKRHFGVRHKFCQEFFFGRLHFYHLIKTPEIFQMPVFMKTKASNFILQNIFPAFTSKSQSIYVKSIISKCFQLKAKAVFTPCWKKEEKSKIRSQNFFNYILYIDFRSY